MSSSISEFRAKVASLDEAEKAFHQTILLAFPELGRPPSSQWLQAKAAVLEVEAGLAIRVLADRSLIELQAATGAILTAYPFSGIPTPHRVELAGARPVYAMCAVDALGIPFMLGREGVVSSTDPVGSEPVRITIGASGVLWDPPEAVVFVCSSEEPSCDGSAGCARINFFRSEESAQAYRRTHAGLQGCLLPQAEALAYGRQLFGNLLDEHGTATDETPHPCSCC